MINRITTTMLRTALLGAVFTAVMTQPLVMGAEGTEEIEQILEALFTLRPLDG